MDLSDYPKSDPSLLLLNEIEILLAQTRLIELYVKQTQVTAANEAARIQERHQSELAALRSTLAEKEQRLEALQNATSESERRSVEHSQNLQNQLGEQQRRLDQYDIHLRHANTEVAALRERIAQLQAAKEAAETTAQQSAGARLELEAALTALRRELQDNQRDFQRQQIVSQALQENLHEQLDRLRSELGEKQAWAEAGVELQQARIEIAELRQRVTELQASRQGVEAAAAHALEQTRVRFETELAGLQMALNSRDRTLHETQNAIGAIEQSLRSEIETLRLQLGEKQELIESRDGELRVAQEQIAALQQRLVELETAHQQAQANIVETIRLRSSFENEISNLRQEVAVRERALSERQEAVTAVELALHGKIQALQQELARSRSSIEARASEVENARAEADALRQRVDELVSEAESSQAARQALESDLTQLTNTLANKEALLTEHKAHARSLENQLHGEITELRRQLEEHKQLVAQSHTELDRRRIEISILLEQKSQSEEARREFERDQQQALAARQELEERLQAKDDELRASHTHANELREAALREQEARFKAVEEQRGNELALLRSELDQQQSSSELARQELARLQNEIPGLREQIFHAENSRRELDRNWRQTTAEKQELELRLQAQEEELRTVQARANDEKVTALREQEDRYHALEAQLGSEIGHLRFQLEQQQRNFEQGNAELSQLRADTAALQEQRELSEQTRRELEQNWQQTAALRQDFESRLQDKEDELRAAQAKADEIKSQIDAKLGELQLRLTEKQLLAESRATEIENLKVELGRLAEQSAARDSTVEELRARHRNETASSSAAHQAEVTALREEHNSRQRALEERLAQQNAQITALSGEIQQFERRATDFESQIQARERNLAAAAAESASLRARVQELEDLLQAQKAGAESAAEQVRTKLEAELASLRHELQQKAWALAQQQASVENLALAHRNQIQKLEDRLAEQQRNYQDRTGETERAQSQTRSLQRRIEELEMELQHAQLTTVRGAQQIREEYARRIEESNAEVERRRAELQERAAAQSRLEETFRAEIERLVREAEERNLILQNRNDELVQAKSARDALQESYNELASATTRNEAAVSEDVERMRTEFQAQLALLQAELSQKEWALEEQRASASGMDQQYREQIEALRRKLARTEARAPENQETFVLGDGALTEVQQQRSIKHHEVMDVVTTSENRTFPASENRRWRSTFGWKRRWK